MLQQRQQAAASLGRFRVDKADNGILQISLVNLSQRVHGFRLSVVQELEQHLLIHGKQAVIAGRLADHVAVILLFITTTSLRLLVYIDTMLLKVSNASGFFLYIFQQFVNLRLQEVLVRRIHYGS